MPGVWARRAEAFWIRQVSDRAFDVESGGPEKFCGQRGAVDSCHAVAGKGAEGARDRVQDDSGRGGILRSEDRSQAGGRDRPAVAAVDGAVRFQLAAAVWIGVRGRGWIAQAAGDGASGAVW